MAKIEDLQKAYQSLSKRFDTLPETSIDPTCLLTFEYEYRGREAEITIDTEEFTAVCPWTGLPDFGLLTVSYVPDQVCIELKSLKFYLYSYARVGIVQEHAANRILEDLVEACSPIRMTVTLDYNIRGGLHTCVNVNYTKQA